MEGVRGRKVALPLAALAALVLGAPGSATAAERYEPLAKVAPGVFIAEAPDGTVATPRSAKRAQRAPDTRRRPRIVGGAAAVIASWPWQAAVTLNPAFYGGNAFQRQFCGASLVAPTVVITAAHCVYNESSGTFFPVSDHASVTGRTTLSNPGQGQEIAWSDYFVFVNGSGAPLYNPNTNEWDVVFATLASPSPGSNSTPIQIAGASEAAAWAPSNENAWATGWGTTSSGGPKQDTLRQVQIDMIADGTCASGASYGSSFRPETMVCAGEIAGGQDTCQGDSGGPLVVDAGAAPGPPPLTTPRLVGDTSWGNLCALPNFPGVYGRVAQHPMCSALRNGVLGVAGVDPVGPGGCLGADGTAAGFVPVGSLQPPVGGGTIPGAGDGTAPNTRITQAPPRKTKKKRATIAFEADEPVTFECALDGRQQLAPCTSPITVRVKKGRHSFSVQATDLAGNVDPSAATADWKVTKKRRRGR